MKLLVIIMIFISYGYFCDGQGRGKRRSTDDETNISDYESSSSSSTSSLSSRRAKKERREKRKPDIMQETTARILQYAAEMQYEIFNSYDAHKNNEDNVDADSYYDDADVNPDANIDSITAQFENLDISTADMNFYNNNLQLKNIKKTNLCMKYTGYQYLMKLRVNEDLKIRIKNSVNQYVEGIMKIPQIIHVNDIQFISFFGQFLFILDEIVKALISTNYEGLHDVFKQLNYLALDLILDCEVPISYFLQYGSIYVTPQIINYFITSNLTESDDALLNIWTAFLTEEQKGSCSCIKTRLSVLLAVFKRMFPSTTFNIDLIVGMSILNVTKYTNEDVYLNVCSFLNERTIRIIDEILRLQESDIFQHIPMIEDVTVYLIHSLLNCGVPKTHIFRKNKEQEGYSIVSYLNERFLRGSTNKELSFLQTYKPGTLGCFKNSLDYLFKELAEMTLTCKDEYNNFQAKMYEASKKCVPDASPQIFMKCKKMFEHVAIQSLLDFDKCLFSINDNKTLSMKSHIANKFATFQNIYQTCESN